MAKARFYQQLMSTKLKRKGFNHSDDEFSIYLSYTNFYDEPRFKFVSFPLKKEGLDQFDPTRLRGTVVGWLEEFLTGAEFELDDPDAVINKVLVGLEDLIEVGDTSLALEVGVVIRLNQEPEDESGDPDEDVDFEVDPDEALDEEEQEDEEQEYESMYTDEDLDEDAGTQEDEPEYTNVASDEEAGLQEDEPEFTDEYFNDKPEPEPEPEPEPGCESIYLEEALQDEPGYYIEEDMEVQEEYDPMYVDEAFHERMEIEEEEEDEEEDEEVTQEKFELVKDILMDQGVSFQKASDARVPLHGSRCAICLEEFEGNLEEPVAVLLCSHVLHEACLIPSILKSNRTCPLCRQEVLDPDLLF